MVIWRAKGPDGEEILVEFPDQETLQLRQLSTSFFAIQKVRKAENSRGFLQQSNLDALKAIEESLSRQITKALRGHVLWPWLREHPGLAGVHVAAIIGRIRDPRRFPGVRSLWKYGGLYPGADGRLVHKKRGQVAPWNHRIRTSVFQPGGVAEQIVRLRVPHYREIYDRAKIRIIAERGLIDIDGPTDSAVASEMVSGRAVEEPDARVVARGGLTGSALASETGDGQAAATADVSVSPHGGPIDAQNASEAANGRAAELAGVSESWRGGLTEAPTASENRGGQAADSLAVRVFPRGDLTEPWSVLEGSNGQAVEIRVAVDGEVGGLTDMRHVVENPCGQAAEAANVNDGSGGGLTEPAIAIDSNAGQAAETTCVSEPPSGGLTERQFASDRSRGQAVETGCVSESLRGGLTGKPRESDQPVGQAAEASAVSDVSRGGLTESVSALARSHGQAVTPSLGPLRLIQVEKRARTIAAKSFIGDLWREWTTRLHATDP